MRKLVCLAVAVCGLSGCQTLTGDHAHHGWFIGAWKPSSVDQQGVTLISQNPGSTSANPMGTVSGPVIDAQSQHAPIMPMIPAPVPMAPPAPRISGIRTRYAPASNCDPCGPTALTLDEWMRISNAAKSQRMPLGEEK